MFRKIVVIFILAMVITVSASASEKKIIDVFNGNGIDIENDGGYIVVRYFFSTQDPSTKGGKIKYSVPYFGKSSDEGFTLANGGEKFIGVLAGRNILVESESATVKNDGKGPLVIKFKIPKISESTDLVVAVSKDGKKEQWLCIPWECQRLQFARTNDKHPGGAEHRTFFRLNTDGTISDLVEESEKKGWVPVSKYHASEMRGSNDPSHDIFE